MKEQFLNIDDIPMDVAEIDLPEVVEDKTGNVSRSRTIKKLSISRSVNTSEVRFHQ